MPKVALNKVTLRGSGGINITAGGVYIGYRFRTNFSLAIAKALKQDKEAYEQVGEETRLRPFPEFTLPVKIRSATLTMWKDMNLDPVVVGKDVEIRDLKVKRDDAEALFEFQVRVPLFTPEMLEWVVTQKGEAAPKFVIEGKQEEMSFEPAGAEQEPSKQGELPT